MISHSISNQSNSTQWPPFSPSPAQQGLKALGACKLWKHSPFPVHQASKHWACCKRPVNGEG